MKHSDRLTGMVINATDRFVPPEKAEAIVKRLSRKLDKMSLTEIKAELWLNVACLCGCWR